MVAFLLIVQVPLFLELGPVQVNGWAYLTGQEQRATFHPTSYTQGCNRNGSCSTGTSGYLSGSGDVVTWPRKVALGRPFTVHAPVWAWGHGRDLPADRGDAILFAVVGFLAEIELWIFLIVLVIRAVLVRRRSAS